jgi:hypothetical protein
MPSISDGPLNRLQMALNENEPPPDAVEQAKQHPGGWVYKIEGEFGPNDFVPPEAIVGAWKVDEHGIIVGSFIPNPNFRRNRPR